MTPATCGRTSDIMVDAVRPGSSVDTVTSCVASVTTPTSTGPFLGASLWPQAATRTQSAKRAVRRAGRRLGMVVGRFRNEDGGLRPAQGKGGARRAKVGRSEEHTSELQSLMRILYAVF